MNILVTSLPDLKKINPQRPHHLLRYLSEKHNVTVICVNAWWLDEKKDEHIEDLIKNVNFFYLTDKKINPVIQEILSYKSDALKKINLSDFDLHLNLNSLIFGYLVARKMNRLGIPTVFDICDDLPEWIGTSPRIPHLLRSSGKFIGEILLKKNIKLANKITYITKSLYDSYHFPQHKSVLVPNGVDVELFCNQSTRKVRDQLKIGGEFVIGFVGALSGWVDLEPAFSAFKSLTKNNVSIKMFVVGDGEGFQSFKDLAEKYGISDRVIFTGSVPYVQVPQYISCMDICLICRKPTQDSQNALPLKLFEYMACEKPIISTPLTGVKGAVGDRVLYACDAEELKQKIMELYHNEDLRIELGEEGREFVKRNCNWSRICADFGNVLVVVTNE